MDSKKYVIPFSVFDGIGPMTFRNLVQHFNSAENIWRAKETDLKNSPLPKHLLEKFTQFQKTFDLNAYLEKLHKNNVWFWTIDEENYPKLLKEISDSPFVLYYKYNGTDRERTLSLQKNVNIAVVGSRKISSYGRRVTSEIITGFCGNKVTIVSGLALGVDACAHAAAIENKICTIAVLGCGLDIIYPRENIALSERILETGGYIFSEVPLGRWVTRGIFPARNRIISGMSRAVIVTEAAQASGSLITASYALEQGRDVFVVPGPIQNENEKGIISLLRKGASAISSALDILEELGMKNSSLPSHAKIVPRFESDNEKRIFDLLTEQGQTHINEMSRKLHNTISELSATLTMMEIKGMVKNMGNLEYCTNF